MNNSNQNINISNPKSNQKNPNKKSSNPAAKNQQNGNRSPQTQQTNGQNSTKSRRKASLSTTSAPSSSSKKKSSQHTSDSSLYAGATFQNSPSASALPIPQFNSNAGNGMSGSFGSPSPISQFVSVSSSSFTAKTPTQLKSGPASSVAAVAAGILQENRNSTASSIHGNMVPHHPLPTYQAKLQQSHSGHGYMDGSVFKMDDEDHHQSHLPPMPYQEDEESLRIKSQNLLAILKAESSKTNVTETSNGGMMPPPTPQLLGTSPGHQHQPQFGHGLHDHRHQPYPPLMPFMMHPSHPSQAQGFMPPPFPHQHMHMHGAYPMAVPAAGQPFASYPPGYNNMYSTPRPSNDPADLDQITSNLKDILGVKR